MKHQIDASNKILGRLATEIAVLLREKNMAVFAPNKEGGSEVEVLNVENLRVSGNKSSEKLYWRYTGYPGGIRRTTYKELQQRDTGEALRRAVFGMLPKNKLRAKWMRKLTIH